MLRTEKATPLLPGIPAKTESNNKEISDTAKWRDILQNNQPILQKKKEEEKKEKAKVIKDKRKTDEATQM